MTKCIRVNDRRIGRPLGDVSEAILKSLSQSEKSSRQLAEELRCSLYLIKENCRRLRESGRIEIVARIRIAGVNKPVALYGVTLQSAAMKARATLPIAFFEAR